MPEPAAFVEAASRAGIGDGVFVVAYGNMGGAERLWGIRVEEHVETAGLDVSEHGMWGYPEFYIPVPGGYGTDAHGHLGHGHRHAAPALHPAADAA